MCLANSPYKMLANYVKSFSCVLVQLCNGDTTSPKLLNMQIDLKITMLVIVVIQAKF